jgi:hypothetical protein
MKPAIERFDAEPNTAVITCSHVLGGSPVLFVSHDADATWQFLCGADEHTMAEGKVASLASIVGRDRSLGEVASMATSHVATRGRVDAPWQFADETLEDIRTAIADEGFWIGLVPASEEGPSVAYTVGLYETAGHPELLLIGLSLEVMETVLHDCGERIRKGTRFADGGRIEGVIEGFSVALRKVADESSRKTYLPYGVAHHERPFPVLQCLWPDKEGRYPDDPGAAPYLRERQPRPA